MKRDTLVNLAVLAALLLGGVWIATSTEWVDESVRRPDKGEAARNRFFAFLQLGEQLGARMEQRKNLEALPPTGTRLVLSSRHWDLFPERSQGLRRWVEQGGHLVLPADAARDRSLRTWLPIVLADPARERETPPRKNVPPAEFHCRSAEGAGEAYRVCAHPHWRDIRPRDGTAAQWVVQGPHVTEFLRVPMGRGTVTVYGPRTMLHNDELLRVDHAYAASRLLQLERGAQVWLVTEETRTPLLAWVWRNGWVAVLLLLAGLALWIWRSALRFGPVGAAPEARRRSMREQVTGTGDFLWHEAPATLHAAQVRALRDEARARLPGFALLDAPAAAAALARATGLDAAALGDALRPGARTGRARFTDLELLESARRRLRAASRPSPTHQPHATHP
jgi:hypothetical protein